MPYCTRITTAAALICFVWLGWVTVSSAQTANQSEDGVRLFQSRDGETQYVGKLVKLNGSRVTLELEEGESQELRMSDLRREDQVWIRAADRAMRLVAKRREQAKDLIEDLAGAKAEREIKSLCIKLREFGELAADAQQRLQGLMNDPANGEIAYHAAVTFAVVSPKSPENWEALLKALKDGNPQLMLLTQRAPGPMLAGMSLYGQQAFPLLQAAAFTGEITLVAEDWTAAELKKLNTVRGPKNAARASACLSLGQIQSEVSRAVVRSVIKEAAVKLNGMTDSATIEACLAAFGRLGDSNASETLTSYEDQFPATVKKSRELITQYQERAKALAELNKFRATRLFTDRRGNRIRATFENLSEGRVRLKKLDEKMMVVPLENFSEDDQAWILAKVEAMKTPLPEPESKPVVAEKMLVEPVVEKRTFEDVVVITLSGEQRVDAEHPLLKGCVGWWPLTDGDGTHAMDASGYGRTGEIIGGVTWSKGDRGGFLKFDGVDGYLDLRALNFDKAISEGFTFSAWVQASEGVAGSNRLWWVYRNGKSSAATAGLKFTSIGNANQVSAYLQDGSASNSLSDAMVAGNLTDWNHILLTYNSTSGDLVLVANSALVTNANTGGGLRGGNANHTIGAYLAKSEFFKGHIQNVRIFDRVLTATEIKQLYAEPWAGLKPISDSEEGADKE